MDRDLPLFTPQPHGDEMVDPPAAKVKLARLEEHLAPLVREGALVAFSGGLDSAFLLWASTTAAKRSGGRVLALTTTSPSTPDRDREDADSFAKLMEVEHIWRESREMNLPDYVRNDPERCFHCKTELFRIAEQVLGDRGLCHILYGYNASDVSDHRPGHRAALEAGVRAPLQEVGLTKAEIRHLMRQAGLPLSGKPASPCLSSRLTTGVEITPQRLRDVEELEKILRGAGASTFRVRVGRDESGSLFLRVEVPPEEMGLVLDCREELQEEGARRGYRWVTLDLGGYRMGGGVL
jgi:uncharacterized protein